jgi:hypothetical protein
MHKPVTSYDVKGSDEVVLKYIDEQYTGERT